MEGIGDRIAERNPARALSYVRELRERCLRIGEFPHAGPPRPQWGKGIRIAVHGKYLIVYACVMRTSKSSVSSTAPAISMRF
jgi:toxin ParE1/3/4